MKVYLVGGAVRDELLGEKVVDKDWVVVGATADNMLALGFKQVGKDFPVFLHPKTKQEYALARTEKKSGFGYHGFATSTLDVSLEDDLKRRDLTINSIAKDMQGNYIDPFGGVGDLKKRILRHTSESFCEDPLRILRLARFYARLYDYHFHISEQTHQLVLTMLKGSDFNYLSVERIWMEIQKALKNNHSNQFFIYLQKIGLLSRIFPSIEVSEYKLSLLQKINNLPKRVDVRFAWFFTVFQGQSEWFGKLKTDQQSAKLCKIFQRYQDIDKCREAKIWVEFFESLHLQTTSLWKDFMTLFELNKTHHAHQIVFQVHVIFDNINHRQAMNLGMSGERISCWVREKRLHEIAKFLDNQRL